MASLAVLLMPTCLFAMHSEMGVAAQQQRDVQLKLQQPWFQAASCYCSACLTLSLLQVAAEREAWEISKKHNFELVTICPTFVLGPVISNRADATSILEVKVYASCQQQHSSL